MTTDRNRLILLCPQGNSQNFLAIHDSPDEHRPNGRKPLVNTTRVRRIRGRLLLDTLWVWLDLGAVRQQRDSSDPAMKIDMLAATARPAP